MADRTEDVTEAELGILQELWERGPCAVRALVERLYPPGGPSAVATVHKLLERLESKGYVARDRSGPVQVFAPTVDRGGLIDRRLREVAAQLCGGSLGSLVSHLVRGQRLSSDERLELRDFLERLDPEAPPDPAPPDPGKDPRPGAPRRKRPR